MTDHVFVNPWTVRPVDLKPGDVLAKKVVAVVGGTGLDWAAYEGPTDWPDELVVANGDKISEVAAKNLFYATSHLQYRR